MERDNASKNELIEGLKKAAQGNSRNKTARLREIFDDVEAAKDSGLSLKTIVTVLADRGLIFDLATFVNIRHRIKKERVIKDGLIIKSSAKKNIEELKPKLFKKTSTKRESEENEKAVPQPPKSTQQVRDILSGMHDDD